MKKQHCAISCPPATVTGPSACEPRAVAGAPSDPDKTQDGWGGKIPSALPSTCEGMASRLFNAAGYALRRGDRQMAVELCELAKVALDELIP